MFDEHLPGRAQAVRLMSRVGDLSLGVLPEERFFGPNLLDRRPTEHPSTGRLVYGVVL